LSSPAPTDRIDAQVARATQRLAQLRARQLLREMRAASRAKANARRLDVRRRLVLGGIVITAGLGDWEADEIAGILVEGRKRCLGSPTMRLGMRNLGAEHQLDPSPIR
jgi:hypothetical protein